MVHNEPLGRWNSVSKPSCLTHGNGASAPQISSYTATYLSSSYVLPVIVSWKCSLLSLCFSVCLSFLHVIASMLNCPPRPPTTAKRFVVKSVSLSFMEPCLCQGSAADIRSKNLGILDLDLLLPTSNSLPDHGTIDKIPFSWPAFPDKHLRHFPQARFSCSSLPQHSRSGAFISQSQRPPDLRILLGIRSPSWPSASWAAALSRPPLSYGRMD